MRFTSGRFRIKLRFVARKRESADILKGELCLLSNVVSKAHFRYTFETDIVYKCPLLVGSTRDLADERLKGIFFSSGIY